MIIQPNILRPITIKNGIIFHNTYGTNKELTRLFIFALYASKEKASLKNKNPDKTKNVGTATFVKISIEMEQKSSDEWIDFSPKLYLSQVKGPGK